MGKGRVKPQLAHLSESGSTSATTSSAEVVWRCVLCHAAEPGRFTDCEHEQKTDFGNSRTVTCKPGQRLEYCVQEFTARAV